MEVAPAEGTEDGSMSVLWPAGFGVMEDKPAAALVDGDGDVVAHDGDVIQLNGGGLVPPTPARCSVSEMVWYAHAVERPATD